MPHLIAAEVLRLEPEPVLVAALCGACGTTTFPVPDGCPRCTSTDLSESPLPRRGQLWSWTVQRFEPKPPYRGRLPFEPYGVGYVSFADLCIVEGRLTTNDPGELEIGMEMELVLAPFGTDADGEELTTYAFAPAAPVAQGTR